MENIIVTTMPIKPQPKTNIGMCFAPLISEVVAKNLGCKSILSTNLLHSYKNENELLPVYTKTLEELGIEYDHLFVDKEHADILLDCIKELIKQKKVVEKESTVLSCPCGKVDIIEQGVRKFDNGDLYTKQGNSIYCKLCGGECKPHSRTDLYLYLDYNEKYDVNIIPNFLNLDFSHFYKSLPGKYILVSKNRDTGYKVKALSGNEYNLDIDLLWMNYIQCFDEENQILIASNHQLFEMFILNYINNISSKKNLSFIATPYMNKTALDIFSELEKFNDELYKKIALLYTLKWKNKNCDWDSTIFKDVGRLGKENRIELYEIITNGFNEEINDINKYINDYLLWHISMQKNIKTLKRK